MARNEFAVGTEQDEGRENGDGKFLRDARIQIGVEIGLVSTGPERTQTIIVEDSALGRWIAN